MKFIVSTTTTGLWALLAILAAVALDTAHAVPEPPRPCDNNVDFRFNHKEKKSCDWIGARPQRKERLCSKYHVKWNCPETCNVDCTEKRKRCPKVLPNGGCSKYVDGLDCGYAHVYTGCDSSSLQCTPTMHATCTNNEWMVSAIDIMPCLEPKDDIPAGKSCDPRDCPVFAPEPSSKCSDYKGRGTCSYDYRLFGCDEKDKQCMPMQNYECVRDIWVMDTMSFVPCGNKTSPIGEKCDPTVCPSVEPTNGSGCPYFEGEGECQYGYKITGCTKDSLACTPTRLYSCERNVWQMETMAITQCLPTDDELPFGEPCDPDDGKPGLFSECPLNQPESPSSCAAYEDSLTCEYNFVVTGCDEDSFQCSPISTVYCENGVWETMMAIQPVCDDEDTPNGAPCNPDDGVIIETCPATEPENQSSCALYREGEECVYRYNWFGCSDDALSCVPAETNICQDGKWQKIVPMAIPCRDGSDPIHGSCDPKECPIVEPKPGDKCKNAYKGKEDCSYDYKVTGCGIDDLQCSPSKIYTCDTKEDQWMLAIFDQLPCIRAPDTPIGEPCDPNGCPILEPKPFSDCASYEGGEDECYYRYENIGCDKDSLSCAPMGVYSCSENAWTPVAISLPACAAPDDLPIGESCEPGGCPAVSPKPNSDCSDYEGSETCKYDYRYTGCTIDEAKCSAVKRAMCDAEDVWSIMIYDSKPCSYARGEEPPPDKKPSGKACEPCPEVEPADKCPAEKPESKSDCSLYEGGLQCNYDFGYTGCTVDELECFAKNVYVCEDSTWQHLVVDKMPCK